jgi:hypothetical protein
MARPGGNRPGPRGGDIRVDFHGHNAPANGPQRQRGGGLHQPGRANGEEQIGLPGGLIGGGQRLRGQAFAKPDHIGAQTGLAMGAAGHLVRIGPGGNFPALLRADDPADIAVQFDDLTAAGPLVQAVHGLGDEGELLRPAFPLGQGQVAGLGLAWATNSRRQAYQSTPVWDCAEKPAAWLTPPGCMWPTGRSGHPERWAHRFRRKCRPRSTPPHAGAAQFIDESGGKFQISHLGLPG